MSKLNVIPLQVGVGYIVPDDIAEKIIQDVERTINADNGSAEVITIDDYENDVISDDKKDLDKYYKEAHFFDEKDLT